MILFMLSLFAGAGGVFAADASGLPIFVFVFVDERGGVQNMARCNDISHYR